MALLPFAIIRVSSDSRARHCRVVAQPPESTARADTRDEVPRAFREMVDEPTYRRSVDYTLAKSRFGDVVTLFDAVLLIAVLFSGILPWAFVRFTAAFGTSVWAMAGFLFATGFAFSIVSLPFAWYAQFKLEDRFGFNTTTAKTWVLDRLKGFLLATLLRVSIACAGVEADRVDWPKLVDLGSGGRDRVPIAFAADCPCSDHAALQQVHAAAGRFHLARTPLCAGAAHRFPNPQHRSNGRQQTVASLQRLLHRIRTFSQNCPFRHTSSPACRAGTGIRACA